MKFFVHAAVAALIFQISAGSPAAAADLTGVSAAPRSWSGCYVGAHAGYVRGDDDSRDLPFNDDPYAGEGFSWNGSDFSSERIGMSDSAFIGGVEAGCDRQFDLGGAAFVLGGVVDLDVTRLSGRGTSAINDDTHTTFGADWMTSARARAGFAFSDVLVYGTGGVALGKIDVRAYDTASLPTPGLMDVSKDSTRAGWVAGAGIEWRVKPEWSVGLEYLHYDFGSITATGAAISPAGAFPRYRNDVDFDTVRVGVKWRF